MNNAITSNSLIQWFKNTTTPMELPATYKTKNGIEKTAPRGVWMNVMVNTRTGDRLWMRQEFNGGCRPMNDYIQLDMYDVFVGEPTRRPKPVQKNAGWILTTDGEDYAADNWGNP